MRWGVIESSVEVVTVRNILVGGVIGLGVDAMSGAINKYEPETTIEMQPIEGCKRGQRVIVQRVSPDRAELPGLACMHQAPRCMSRGVAHSVGPGA